MDIGLRDIPDSPQPAPPPGVYWRCAWVIAHVVLFASPFVHNHQQREPELLMAFTFPVILGMMQAAFLHRHLRASLLWVPATCLGVAAMFGGVFFFERLHRGEWIVLILPVAIPVCQLPMLALSRFRRVALWPVACMVGWGVGAAAIFLFERALRNESTIGFFAAFVGLCYGGGSLLGLAFPRQDATFRLVSNEGRESR
jgi:hypothetical protein